MKPIHKLTAAVLSGNILLTVLPLTAVSAANEEMTAVITLNGDSVSAEGENVTVDGTAVTITASGAYELSGTLDDGQIIVNVPDEAADPGTVKLFFNGVSITGLSEAPILVENAENTSINLMDDTENFLYDGESYTNTTAVIYAKDDITIKSSGELGNGKLRIEATYQQGLHCNNDVKITGGNIKVKTETEDGIRGKTSVEIKGGKLDVNAGGDGVKSTKGDVRISDGEIEIKAGNDAVQGETSVQISGGRITANGDRGLTNAAGAVTITGGEILATATDNQAAVADNTQPVLLFNTAEEQLKDQAVQMILAGTDEIVFDMNPDKKFDFVLISSPNLETGSSYELNIGGNAAACNPFVLDGNVTTLTDVAVDAKQPADPDDPLRFDINEDGTVDVSDAVLLARYAAQDVTAVLSDVGTSRADTDGDGLVTAADIIPILRRIAKLD